MTRTARLGALTAAGIAVAVGLAYGGAVFQDRRFDAQLATASLDDLRRQAADPGHQRDAKIHYWFGIRLSEAGRASEALAALTRSAQLDPGYAPTRYALGVLLEQTGRPEDSEGQFLAAVKADPKASLTHFTLGRIYGKYNRWRQAVASLEMAHRLEPTNPEISLGLAMAYHELAQRTHEPWREQARALLEQLEKQTPRDVRVLKQLAGLYVFFNQMDQAEARYRKILEIDPGDFHVRMQLGRSIAEKAYTPDQFAEAEKLLASCAADAPLDPDVALAKGILAFRHDQPKEAVIHLRRAVSLRSREPETWFYLGRALTRTGDRIGARAADATYARRDKARRTIRALETRLAFDDNSPKMAAEMEKNRLELARLLIADGMPDRAVPHLRTVLDRHPENRTAAALLRRCEGTSNKDAVSGG